MEKNEAKNFSQDFDSATWTLIHPKFCTNKYILITFVFGNLDKNEEWVNLNFCDKWVILNQILIFLAGLMNQQPVPSKKFQNTLKFLWDKRSMNLECMLEGGMLSSC